MYKYIQPETYMDLLLEINNAVNEHERVVAIITENITRVAEKADIKIEILSETVTNWLAKVKNVIRDEKLQPQQVENTATILAALMSLGNKQDEEAFDVDNLGSVLYNMQNPNVDPRESKEALITLRGIGQYQNTYKEQALQAINDPGTINNFIGKIQAAIEPVMNRNMSKESQAKSSETQNSLIKPSNENDPDDPNNNSPVDQPTF